MSGYTKVNNWLFDTVMPDAKPNTFKVVCAVARCTWGWNKKQDKISLSRFQELTGIGGKSSLSRAISDAIDCGYIERVQVGMTFAYSTTSPKTGQVMSQNGTSTSPEMGQETSPKTGHTKEQREITLLKQPNGDSGAVFFMYESEIGMTSKVIADQIVDAINEFGAGSVKEAIEIAAKANVRKWAYIDGILKRWRANGKGPSKKGQKVSHAEGGGVYV